VVPHSLIEYAIGRPVLASASRIAVYRRMYSACDPSDWL
jgi:hypothetical protein